MQASPVLVEPRDLANPIKLRDLVNGAIGAGKWVWGKVTKGRLGGPLKPKPEQPPNPPSPT